MSQQEMKLQAAREAVNYIQDDIVLGVGTGSTVNCLIALLADMKARIKATIASSTATKDLLVQHGLPVVDFNTINELLLYIDGADSYNNLKQLVKGGGGALTREKILAYASKQFICIVDETKSAEIIGKFPVPIEVLPMTRSFVAREITKLKGLPILREDFTTDNGNLIIDVHNWEISEPIAMEHKLNNIPGVVSNGIFAERPADKIIVGHRNSVLVL